MFITFSDFLMVKQILKRSLIISNKRSIYELSNDSVLRKLGNIREISKFHRIIA